MNTRIISSILLTASLSLVSPVTVIPADLTPAQSVFTHPWSGKTVGVIGDSISDPKLKGGKIKNWWSYLSEWIGITPKVTAVSGRQWDDVPRQAQKLKEMSADSLDAILVFLGTNDFNKGLPIGQWYTETDTLVMAAKGEPKALQSRRHRQFIMTDSTYRGRINIGLSTLKSMFPDKQIVLITPIHRGLADFNDKNVQPDENYANSCGEYVDAYINSVKEAGNLWGVPVIDLNAVSGLNPMVSEQISYFYDSEKDRLHPASNGQERMASTLLYQLVALPGAF
ncbi:MAG: SGNH/GDSL hydrolase family protein [Muribaculaceae bacterium]|nr:SGNH/GDSL hydrolase family protein [Muribaculaceae bacterium]